MAHRLKTFSTYFQAVIDGEKPFEIRQNDRDFKVGDICILEEYLGNEVIKACKYIGNCKRLYPSKTTCHGSDRLSCHEYLKENYTNRFCVIEIKKIYNLARIGLVDYVAFTFDILSIVK